MAKNSERKMVKASSGEPSPTEQGGVLKNLIRWNAYLENIAKLIGYPVLILLVVAVVKNVVVNRKGRILLDPVTVPKILEDEGYTGLEAANVVAANISQIQQETTTIARKERFESLEPKLDIALPQSGISLTSAIAFLAQSVGFAERHAHAELTVVSGTNWDDNTPINILISAQLTGAESDTSSTLVKVKTPNDAFRNTAIEVLKVAEPDVLAMYKNEHDHDIDAALESAERARDQRPRDPEVYVSWGWILTSKRDFKEAITKYNEALIWDPKNALAHGFWANTLLQEGDFAKAIDQCKTALALNPKYADAHDYWGNALQAERNHEKDALKAEIDYKQAIDQYQMAIYQDPQSRYAYSDLGNTLRSNRHYVEAKKEYQKELEFHPKNAIAHGNWGYTLLLEQDYDGAIEQYKEALELEKTADAYSNFGCALQGERDYEEAIEQYKLAFARDPNYVDVYSNWGNALQGKGDYEGAIALYNLALVLDPKSADVYSNWVDVPLLVAFECSIGC